MEGSKLFNILDELSVPEQNILVNLVEGAVDNLEENRHATGAMAPGVSIDEFAQLCGKVLEEEQRLGNIGDRVFFRQTFSPMDYGEDDLKREFNIDGRPNEIISFKILKRTPGSMKGGNTPHDRRRREIIPHVREIVKDEEYSGYHKYIYGLWFDNSVEFSIWSLNNKTADGLALWFEEVMLKWRWYFLINGVNQVLYTGRGEDNAISEALSSDKNMLKDLRLASRPLVFYVRTEKIFTVREKDLERIFINIHASTS